MGVSHNLFSISEVQDNQVFLEHLKGLKAFDAPDFLKKENDSRLPTINEIYRSIALSELHIDSERKSIDNFQPENNQQVVHVFDLIENKDSYSHDLTIRYKKDVELDERIDSISGIKTDLRILVKFASSLTKICGSYFILNPYEFYFIDKDKNFQQLWAEIKMIKNSS